MTAWALAVTVAFLTLWVVSVLLAICDGEGGLSVLAAVGRLFVYLWKAFANLVKFFHIDKHGRSIWKKIKTRVDKPAGRPNTNRDIDVESADF